jgi:hypothetical protein
MAIPTARWANDASNVAGIGEHELKGLFMNYRFEFYVAA